MTRTGDQWIEETPDMLWAKAEKIAKLEERLCSGKLSPVEFETVLIQIRNLRGLPPVEFDYDPPDDCS
jgi:hypothetical protein